MVWFDDLVRDIRFAIRQLIKNPGFTATAILVLALGMGASVATFGFVDAALLEPLPYTNPSQLMSVNESSDESPRWPLASKAPFDSCYICNRDSSIGILSC